MTTYTAPLRDMEFVLNEIADLPSIAELPGYEEASADLVSAILEESAKLSSEVLAPINHTGDQQGSRLVDGKVIHPDGWKAAYNNYVEGGWGTLTFAEEHGGQSLPKTISTAVYEMWDSANIAFSLCPMLTYGAANAILLHASKDLQKMFAPKLISGEWAGTMNLTESQAGSDLSAITTKAIPEGDHYLISGQKIFITYGEQDLTENIIHLVLARTPDAPEGVKGISLFIVPKIMVDADGNLGDTNDIRCVSLEHKLGIHGSPTAVMAYGDNGGAIGYLVGEENQGLIYMFTMMNAARLSVGLEGLGIAERAYQQALAYANERIQGRPVGAKTGDRVPIIHHPDVRRMLMTMKSQIEAMRALSYYTYGNLDKSTHSTDSEARKQHRALYELLTPVVKGWLTETGIEITSIGIQVHGGMGYIEETGAAQHLRDARITSIYEGTTAIQANDLIGRKLSANEGATIQALILEINKTLTELSTTSFKSIHDNLASGISHLKESVKWMLSQQDPTLPAAASVLFLHLMGNVTGGWLMAKSALIAQQKIDSGKSDANFYKTKIVTAQFFCEQILPKSGSLKTAIIEGSETTMLLDIDQF